MPILRVLLTNRLCEKAVGVVAEVDGGGGGDGDAIDWCITHKKKI